MRLFALNRQFLIQDMPYEHKNKLDYGVTTENFS